LKAKQAVTAPTIDMLILEVFRLNAGLLSRGDELVADLGLTSARWQVLGAVARAPVPETVAQLARALGAHRQGVQRIVNELAREGFVAFRENPHHRRAQLIVLTEKGSGAYREAMLRREPWISGLVAGLSEQDLGTAHDILLQLRTRLEGHRREAGN
jgi:DNA-binding MarR family transcriptional regulator